VTVEVRLFATLTGFLPPGSDGGAATLDVPDGSTVGDVVRRLGIPPDMPAIVLVNGIDAETDRPLAPSDVLTMFPPLAGG
jgi:molybdopterin synthase sulfur carrier subunit